MSDAGRDKFNQGLELESVLNELIVEEELDGYLGAVYHVHGNPLTDPTHVVVGIVVLDYDLPTNYSVHVVIVENHGEKFQHYGHVDELNVYIMQSDWDDVSQRGMIREMLKKFAVSPYHI